MSKKIVVVKAHKDEVAMQIVRDTAAKYGYTAELYGSLDEAKPHLEDAEIIHGMGMGLLKYAPNAKWYCISSAGVNGYDADYFDERGVLVSNSAGTYGTTIAEHIIMMATMIMRHMFMFEDYRRSGTWLGQQDIHEDFRTLCGSRILVLGTGNLGATFASRVRSFEPASIIGGSRSGREVKEFDRVVKMDELDSELPNYDLIVMCLPGTPETDNILNKERLALLSKDAIIINVGRGNAIDEEALVEALKNDRIAAAALDVFKEEPLPEESPLWHTKNLYVTPHVSGQETAHITRELNMRMFAEDIENYCEGRPLKYAVDLRRGY
ncbi:MAG: D-2-hydroxyacid dehydrogenase [Firmicutes bacterium]|nr:D-2-hydroxyacid dehydrogenase [Bacillota bacterium]